MKNKDQQLLGEIYQLILEAETPDAPTQQQDSSVYPNKEKHIKILKYWSGILRDPRINPPNPNMLQSLRTFLVLLTKETQDPIKQKAIELAKFLGQSLPYVQGSQGRAALLFATQKMSKEIENLITLALKG